MSDSTAKVRMNQGGNKLTVESGGIIDIESGGIISADGSQASAIPDAKVDYTTGDLDTEAEQITALNTTNGKINSILTALRNAGIIASS